MRTQFVTNSHLKARAACLQQLLIAFMFTMLASCGSSDDSPPVVDPGPDAPPPVVPRRNYPVLLWTARSVMQRLLCWRLAVIRLPRPLRILPEVS